MVDERVGDFLRVFVPMLEHLFVNHHSAAFGQVGVWVEVLYRVFHRVYHEHVLSVRREAVVLDASAAVGELLASASVGVHHPELTFADEGDFVAEKPWS